MPTVLTYPNQNFILLPLCLQICDLVFEILLLHLLVTDIYIFDIRRVMFGSINVLVRELLEKYPCNVIFGINNKIYKL